MGGQRGGCGGPSQFIKRAQIGRKWTENASERVDFSKFSYPSALVALDTTTFKISPPPFLNPLTAPDSKGKANAVIYAHNPVPGYQADIWGEGKENSGLWRLGHEVQGSRHSHARTNL